MFNWKRRKFPSGFADKMYAYFSCSLIVSTVGQIFPLTHIILFTKSYNKTFPRVLSKITSISLQLNYLHLNATWRKHSVLKSFWQSGVCASDFLIISQFSFLLLFAKQVFVFLNNSWFASGHQVQSLEKSGCVLSHTVLGSLLCP